MSEIPPFKPETGTVEVTPVDAYDITGLTPEAAREYIIQIAAHEKLLASQISQANTDLALWNQRAQAAETAGKPELSAAALAKVQEVTALRTKLEIEQMDVQGGLERMKARLKTPEFLTPRTVNAESLLESMEAVTGKVDMVTPHVKQTEAENALEALKRRLDPNYVPPAPEPASPVPPVSETPTPEAPQEKPDYNRVDEDKK